MEYFLQQLINGLTLGSIYGLIAIGYTMVYGIIGMINFAHGDIFMIGAFIALIGFLVAGRRSASPVVPLVLLHRADRRHGLHRALGLDGRAPRLPAAARLVPAGAADLRHRHVDLPAELRPGGAGRPRQAAAADRSPAASTLMARRRRLRRADLANMQILIIVTTLVLMAVFSLLITRTAARPRAARLRAGPQDGVAARRQRRPHDLADLRHGRGARRRRRADVPALLRRDRLLHRLPRRHQSLHRGRARRHRLAARRHARRPR